MNWTESTVTKLLIKDVPRLDPVTVYIENFELGRGKLTIEVFGDSWSAGWGAMGKRTLEEFVLSTDNHYLSKNLSTLSALSEDDYDGFIEKCYEQIIEMRRSEDYDKEKARELWDKVKDIVPEKEWFHDSSNHDLLYEIMGCEWWHSIPSKDSTEFIYLCRILDAVKACLKERSAKITA